MSEQTPDASSRLEQIRERATWGTLTDEDAAWLVAEVARLQMKRIEDCRVLHGYINDRDIEVARLRIGIEGAAGNHERARRALVGRAEKAEAEVARRDKVLESLRALLTSEIADVIGRRVRAARGDVRCLDCNIRYEERSEYGCHTMGHIHDFDQGDLVAAEEIERSNPVEYVTLSVADLRAALDTSEAPGEQTCPSAEPGGAS
jgi:hypothetical protein